MDRHGDNVLAAPREPWLDRERARLWTIAQTVAWAFDEAVLATHVETVRWVL